MRAVLLVLALLVLLLPSGVEAQRFGPYRWPAGQVIVVENRMGPEWNEAVAFTVASWKRAFPRLKYKVIHRPNRECGWEGGRIVLCLGNVYYGNVLVDGRTITAGQVKIYPEPVVEVDELWRGQVYIGSIYQLCHEFGHALGLAHTSQPNSCMAQTLTRMTPSRFDRQSLLLLYNRTGPK